MSDNLFDKIVKKTNVKKEDILNLAKSIQSPDLKDEKNLRRIIKEVGKMAGKEVSKEKEEKIIEAVKQDKVPKKFDNVL